MIEMPADVVRQVRLSRRLTMSGLAELSQVPTSTISRIESGRIEPTVAMLTRIATAAGFRYEPVVTEAGSDQTFADTLQNLSEAGPSERERITNLLPVVSSTAPVTHRTGIRRFVLPGDLVSAMRLLQDQNQRPIVSGMEAVAESIDPVRSFIPIVYVDDPAQTKGFAPADRNAFQVMLLLQTTDNVRRWTRNDTEFAMVNRDWAWLDAMASPGRQGDIARGEYESSRPASHRMLPPPTKGFLQH